MNGDMQKKACVTGGNGFMASLLVKHLLAKGYAVNATVHNLGNPAKISRLAKLQGHGKLKLFPGELSSEGSFDEAVSGCHYVFHVAARTNAVANDPENELIKPAIQGVLNVMRSCLKAKTVKRMVMTSTLATLSIVLPGGTGWVVDEHSWTDTDFLMTEKPPLWGYPASKTLAEKEAWKFAEENGIDLVTVIPAMMLGTPLDLDAPRSIRMGLALLLGRNEDDINEIKVMQQLSGSVPIVHVEDACRAHIFVAETESASGRYICCAINASLHELALFLPERYPAYHVLTDLGDDASNMDSKLRLSSKKLVEAGYCFEQTKLEKIYDEVVEYAKVAGLFPNKYYHLSE